MQNDLEKNQAIFGLGTSSTTIYLYHNQCPYLEIMFHRIFFFCRREFQGHEILSRGDGGGGVCVCGGGGGVGEGCRSGLTC